MEEGIVKEQREDGSVVFRDRNFKKEIDTTNLHNTLDWRTTLMMDKFKCYLNSLGDCEEAIYIGMVLSPIINEVEKELSDISCLIQDCFGKIHILYDEDTRYNNFYDLRVTGIVLKPLNGTPSKKEATA